jgi:hypothetical protein
VINPYKTLAPLFENWDDWKWKKTSDMESIADGGAALTAYAKLQYVDMTPKNVTKSPRCLNIAGGYLRGWL